MVNKAKPDEYQLRVEKGKGLRFEDYLVGTIWSVEIRTPNAPDMFPDGKLRYLRYYVGTRYAFTKRGAKRKGERVVRRLVKREQRIAQEKDTVEVWGYLPW